MTYCRAILVLVNKNMMDGMFTLTIYRHFIVWLLALFFPLGGFQDRSDPVWLMLLLSPAPVLGFWVVGVSVRCCLYGTVHVCVRKMGQWA